MTDPHDVRWMKAAIDLSRRCPPSATAFSVGAIIVSATDEEVASGYSREFDPLEHAEEAALTKLVDRPDNAVGSTLYSTLEPCSARASRLLSCTALVLRSGITRVVIAWREPPLFVEGRGYELLTAAGIAVDELPECADEARQVNDHLAPG
ncbi:dCMP deaminase [Umezawaea tangerina]|uniref:Diaminohydroxyphosphoribosylaminopyrimidine deaminase n=1 Tax=Umezawaea tangerina TaxID=84725 RepID=A0A2T0SZQ3_9PSEU|nr:dCMP deaminase [Umezawaea tangerina]PRY38898.1 diaminohydroxyphosphoribosylaminopyrimidine deaminase [Umezawaea tangerina]